MKNVQAKNSQLKLNYRFCIKRRKEQMALESRKAKKTRSRKRPKRKERNITSNTCEGAESKNG